MTNEQFKAVCQACWGPKSQVRVAHHIGYTPQHINRVWHGRAPVSRKLHDAIVEMGNERMEVIRESLSFVTEEGTTDE